MKFKPYKYQQTCINRIKSDKALGLFLDCGLGKTVITLTAINDLMFDSLEVDKVLIIAPLRVAQVVWSDEVEKWEHLKHLRISKVLGSPAKRKQALDTYADIYIINRENLYWLVHNYEWDFDMVVIDELSSFKSSKSRRFRALRKVLPKIKRIVGLTGTPAPNSLLDLWSQLFLLDRGARLGKTLTAYRDRYFKPGKRNGNIVYEWVLRPFAEEQIYKSIEDICLSMKAEDWLELPEKVNRKIEVVIQNMDRYKELEREYILQDTSVVASTAAVLANKLLQYANGAVYDDEGKVVEVHDEKLKALEEIVEAACGKPVMIFYSYKHDLDRIKQRLDVRELKTEEDVRDWNAGKIPLLVAHPASCGHGLNLQTGGSVIVWFGLTWSLELYIQANARLYRRGQQDRVIVHHIVAKNTIDEEVLAALENKNINQEALLQAVKARYAVHPPV